MDKSKSPILSRRAWMRQSVSGLCFIIPLFSNGKLGQPVLAPGPWFVDVAKQAGLSAFRNTCGTLAKDYLVENAPVTVTFVEDKAVSIELPSSVVLKVADAPEGIRGDSANNVQKSVTMETGITVQAPLFIKTGERIKIDTRTGKYMERA